MQSSDTGKLLLSVWGVQELQIKTGRLRRLNRRARQVLLRVAGGRITRDVSQVLDVLALQMVLTIEQCAEIIASAQVPTVSEVVFAFVCPDCPRRDEPYRDLGSEWAEIPESDPAHYDEIVALQELTSRVFEVTSARCAAQGIVQRALHCSLDRLNRALRRQRRYLEQRGQPKVPKVQLGSPKVKIRWAADRCAVCGGDMKTLMERRAIPHDPYKPVDPDSKRSQP